MARDLGSGPHKPFGSALQGKHRLDPLRTPELSKVRAIRPMKGRCPKCGDRFFGCEHDEEGD